MWVSQYKAVLAGVFVGTARPDLGITCGFPQRLGQDRLAHEGWGRNGLRTRVGAGPADLGFTAATEKAKRIEAGTRAAAFVAVRAAQLNEAEYAGPLIAVLLYLHSKNIAAPIGSFLVAFGAILHFWAQVLLRTRAAQPLGAVPRYLGMGCLLYALSGAI